MKIYNDANRFVIDWTLNSLCTYHCSYCPEGLHRGVNHIKSKQEDPALVKQFLVKLKDYLGSRSVHIFLNGGEPTISPSFETIIDFCAENNWCAYTNTNASRSIEWWQEYADKIYKVTVSYHPETADDSIFEKVRYIGSRTNVGVFTLMYPPYWDKAITAYNSFLKMDNVTLAPSRVFNRQSGASDVSYEYSAEQLDWLEKNSNVLFRGNTQPPPAGNYWGNTYIETDGISQILDEVSLVNSKKNTFVDWKCNMGVDHIYIDQFGNIKQSACRQAETFSSIVNFTGLLVESTVCKTAWCMCTADVLIPKEI